MSSTGYLLSDGTTDLSAVFVNINGPSLLSQNIFQQKTIFSGGLDLSNCFLYGRNDGHAFDISSNSMYPIGFTSSTFTTTTGLAPGPKYVTNLPIYPGTWLVSYRSTARGNTTNIGTYSTSAALFLDLSANANITYPNSNRPPKSITPLLPTVPISLYVNPMPIFTVVRVSSNTTLQANAALTGISNVGNTVNISESTLSITKIA